MRKVEKLLIGFNLLTIASCFIYMFVVGMQMVSDGLHRVPPLDRFDTLSTSDNTQTDQVGIESQDSCYNGSPYPCEGFYMSYAMDDSMDKICSPATGLATAYYIYGESTAGVYGYSRCSYGIYGSNNPNDPMIKFCHGSGE